MKRFLTSLFAGTFFITTLIHSPFAPHLKRADGTLSPLSALAHRKRQTPAEIDALLLQRSVRLLLCSFDTYEMVPPSHTLVKAITQDQLPYPNGKNIYISTQVGALPIWLGAAQQIPGVNLILVPPGFENMIHQPEELQPVQIISGIFLNRNNELIYGVFQEPLPVHAAYDPGKNRELLEKAGLPMLSSQQLGDLTHDKDRVKKVLKEADVPVPYGEVVRTMFNEFSISKQLEQMIQLSNLKGKVVVKPNSLSGGKGVRMFDDFLKELNQIKEYIYQFLGQEDWVLIESRIEPPGWLNKKGTEMDWNLRVLVTENGRDEPVVTGIEVRAAPKSFDAVNVSKGAEVLELDAVLNRFVLTNEKREEIIHRVEQVSIKTVQAIQQYLKENFPSKNLSCGMIGLDLIFDRDFYPFVMEVNSGYVGGIGSLAKIRTDENKFLAAEPFVVCLAHLAALNSPQSKREEQIVFNQDSFSVWTSLASEYEFHKQYSLAIWAYEKALALKPEDDVLLTRLGQVYQEVKNVKQAEALFKKALALNPANPKRFITLAFFYQETGDHAAAKEWLLKGIERFPREAGMYYQLDQIYQKEKAWQKIEALMRTALQELPHMDDFWVELGFALVKQERYAEAERALEKALSMDTENVNALIHLGSLNMTVGRPQDARVLLVRALNLDPYHASANAHYGKWHHEYGNVLKSQKYFERALKYNENEILALSYLGYIYLKNGRMAQAKKYYQKVNELEPDDIRGLIGLASVCLFSGALVEAEKFLDLAEGVEPDHPQFVKLKQHFQQLLLVAQTIEIKPVLNNSL